MYNNNYYPFAAPLMQVIKVNGENGARAYQMPANSSALLIDESEPKVYLLTTDGAGYKTVSTYSIKPFEPEPKPDFNALTSRIERLEGIVNESYASNAKQKQSNQQSYAGKTDAQR